VIRHWPLDEAVDAALRRCVASFPADCERIVVVNDGTGYGRNVNIGLRLATGDFVAVVNNDCPRWPAFRLRGGAARRASAAPARRRRVRSVRRSPADCACAFY